MAIEALDEQAARIARELAETWRPEMTRSQEKNLAKWLTAELGVSFRRGQRNPKRKRGR